LNCEIVSWDEEKQFQVAYSKADQQMMATGEAIGMGLGRFNGHNAKLIASFLSKENSRHALAAELVTREMEVHLGAARRVLQNLHGQVKLGIISNFTGNLETILEEQSLKELFHSITESYYAHSSKPDLQIFHKALAHHRGSVESTIFVGDNPRNDIFPAQKLGMKTVLIHEDGNREECGADYYIRDLLELEKIIHSP
jgi:putative hydrolase of the HAD superfamily